MPNLITRSAEIDLADRVRAFRAEFQREGVDKTASILGRVTAIPVRAIGGKIKNVLLGPIAKSGPFKGQRMSRLPGKAGWRSVSKREFLGIQSGRVPGRAVRVAPKGGAPGYFAEVHGRGGVVGVVQRNPGKTALGVGGAYLLGTSPTVREMVAGLLPSRRENPVAPEVEKMFAGPATPPVHPIARPDWKPTTTTTVVR